MKILSVETCTGTCSVSVSSGNKILAELVEKDISVQAEKLVPMMDKAMKKARLDYEDIDLLAATVGPGSFTGVRIGLAAIAGIKIVTGLDVVGISTLEAAAWKCLSQLKPNEKIKFIDVFINANRGQSYWQRFSADKNLKAKTEPALIETKSIDKKIDGVVACSSLGLGIGKDIVFSATDVAELAMVRYSKGKFADNLVPLYIRPPDAKLPKKSA